ncbi:MAG: glycosyltransferase family 39 protein [Bryobacteraceae bacterium]
MSIERPRPVVYTIALVGIALYLLFVFRLAGTGLVSADEPRYASIGREMARSGDWVTPRLWGDPWFEKSALLYWMTGAAFRLGLNADLAPRLPVAACSVLFLAISFSVLRKEFGLRAAWFSVLVLGTSAGWLALSHVAIPDLPMSALFSLSMLLCLGWLRNGERRRLPWAAALLASAVLAKGLVPLVLALPLAWFGRRRILDLLRPPVLIAFLLVAAPWYVLCYLRNGWPFVQIFFIQHQFGRFFSGELQHVQPFWFYLPVLASALFPWTGAATLLANPGLYSDSRRRFLLTWLLFGLLFFSYSTNKLPGYILPLLPAAAVLIGLALDEAADARWILASAAALLCILFPLASVLPQALAAGLSRARFPAFQPVWLAPLLLAPLVWRLEQAKQRNFAVILIAALATTGVAYLKLVALPAIDASASARSLWHRLETSGHAFCVEPIHRSWLYGLNYYSVTPLPDCAAEPGRWRVTQEPGSIPTLTAPRPPL